MVSPKKRQHFTVASTLLPTSSLSCSCIPVLHDPAAYSCIISASSQTQSPAEPPQYPTMYEVVRLIECYRHCRMRARIRRTSLTCLWLKGYLIKGRKVWS